MVFGTRPEAIKMAPLFHEMSKLIEVKICVTAQHREMLDQVLDVFNIVPDYDFNIMQPGQDLFDITSNVLKHMKKVLIKEMPDMVLVHGDTTTSMAASLAAFYLEVPVGHIEAGLRTYNIYSPFPEEINRQLTSRISSYHFAPTENDRKNLINEHVSNEKILVTGNTVIDALLISVDKARKLPFSNEILNELPFLSINQKHKIILITGHRRENFGVNFEQICLALKDLAKMHPDVQFVYPVHLNPKVSETVHRVLNKINNIYLIKPQDYLSFIKLMDLSFLVLTDSGGIQEEAPSLKKPVLVMRDSTERSEGIKAGVVKLVGVKRHNIVKEVDLLLTDSRQYKSMLTESNPFGDGKASKRILKKILELIK